MISKDELKQVVLRDKYPLSVPRTKYIEKISPWMNRKEIIIIKGIRRCGKTHIMYQLIENLPKDNTFYVNFDDFRLDKSLSVELLQEILELRNKSNRAYFFLDEIQRVNGFEKWLRTHYDREINVKFIIGGSNISLLSPEMSTVLTGRNITFNVFPLSYSEFKSFSKDSFEGYMEFGGFPEIVLEQDNVKKRELLSQYVSDIIARDILDRYKVDNPHQLKSLITFFLANPGVRMSANKLAGQLGIHKDTAQKYISYAIDSFLIFEVPYFSYSAKNKYVLSRASKYYVTDNGMHTIVSIKMNLGRLYENAVAIRLKMQDKDIMYWLNGNEIDFVYEKTALQVTSSDKILNREIEAFKSFEEKHKNFAKILVGPFDRGQEEDIQIVPIEKFLISDTSANQHSSLVFHLLAF